MIEPRRRTLSLGLSELWARRELLRMLTMRDIQIRYKQTFVGIAWALVQPLVTTAIFTVIFSTFGRFDTGSIPYPAFVLAGLAIWLFIYGSVTVGSASFVNNANLVTKIYFPRLLVPISATLAFVLDLAVSLVLLLILCLIYGIVPGVQILLAPVFIGAAMLLAASLSIMLSALTVRFRDVKFILPFALQILMIASPIFYPSSIIPDKWRMLFALNPLTGILDGFRSSVFGTAYDWPVMGASLVSLGLIAIASIVVFRAMEDDFADVI